MPPAAPAVQVLTTAGKPFTLHEYAHVNGRSSFDATAVDWPTVFVSAGRRALQVELAPADLVLLTAATVAAIGRSA